MILNIGNKKLNCVQVIEENPVNNTYICEELEEIRKYYTVWELKERTIAKELLMCQEYTGYVYQERIYFLFPYEEPRLIMNYYWHVTSEYPNLKAPHRNPPSEQLHLFERMDQKTEVYNQNRKVFRQFFC